MTDTLKPVEVSNYYINRIASGMNKYFWENIFKSIFDILKNTSIDNAGEGDLIKAIKSGTIWYENGAFKTKNRFSNSIATVLEKLGAKYYHGTYKIPKLKLPNAYIQAIEYATLNQTVIGDRISNYLLGVGSILSKVDLGQYINAVVESTFKKLQLDIIKSAQEKNVPVIELGIVEPKVKLPKAKTKEIETYWKEQDKKADELNKAILKAQKQGKDTTELKSKLKDLKNQSYISAPSYDIKIDDIALNKQTKKISEDYVYNLKYWVKK